MAKPADVCRSIGCLVVKAAVDLLIFLLYPMIYVMADGILFTLVPAGTYLRSAGCNDIWLCECLWSSLELGVGTHALVEK